MRGDQGRAAVDAHAQAQAAGQLARRQGRRQLEGRPDGGDRIGERGHDPFAHGLDQRAAVRAQAGR